MKSNAMLLGRSRDQRMPGRDDVNLVSSRGD
jgi:hypothetical protein